jgi:hypothetical protein
MRCTYIRKTGEQCKVKMVAPGVERCSDHTPEMVEKAEKRAIELEAEIIAGLSERVRRANADFDADTANRRELYRKAGEDLLQKTREVDNLKFQLAQLQDQNSRLQETLGSAGERKNAAEMLNLARALLERDTTDPDVTAKAMAAFEVARETRLHAFWAPHNKKRQDEEEPERTTFTLPRKGSRWL